MSKTLSTKRAAAASVTLFTAPNRVAAKRLIIQAERERQALKLARADAIVDLLADVSDPEAVEILDLVR